MATLNLKSNESFSVDVTVVESDKYTQDALVRIQRNYTDEDIVGYNELFMSPSQLAKLGRFLIKQAEEIEEAQKHRN